MPNVQAGTVTINRPRPRKILTTPPDESIVNACQHEKNTGLAQKDAAVDRCRIITYAQLRTVFAKDETPFSHSIEIARWLSAGSGGGMQWYTAH